MYQNPKTKEVPDSPPQLPPSKASLIKASPPPQKKAKLQQSPVMNPKVAVNHIPVKVILINSVNTLFDSITFVISI